MRLPSLIAGETPLIKPIKKQQLTITPFLYLNLIEIRKSKVAPAFRRAFWGSRFALATAKQLDLDAQKGLPSEGWL